MAQFFQAEALAGHTHAVSVRIEKDAVMRKLVAELEHFFEESMNKGIRNFVFDIAAVDFPSTSFIAMLISFAARARQKNGDLVIENAKSTARSNFMTFSAFNYLQKGSLTFVQMNDDEPEIQKRQNVRSERSDAATVPALAEPVQEHRQKIVPRPAPPPTPAKPASLAELEGAEKHSLRIESVAAHLYQLCDFVVEHAQKAGMNSKEIGKIRISVYEACLNVIEHAYHSKPGNWLDLSVSYDKERFVIAIKDYGESSQLKPQSEYDVNKAVEQRKTGGFGMHIIRRSVDKLEYHPSLMDGNTLVLMKRLH